MPLTSWYWHPFSQELLTLLYHLYSPSSSLPSGQFRIGGKLWRFLIEFVGGSLSEVDIRRCVADFMRSSLHFISSTCVDAFKQQRIETRDRKIVAPPVLDKKKRTKEKASCCPPDFHCCRFLCLPIWRFCAEAVVASLHLVAKPPTKLMISKST